MKVGDRVWVCTRYRDRREALIVGEYGEDLWFVECPSLDFTRVAFKKYTTSNKCYGNDSYWIEPMEDRELSLEEKATNWETFQHIENLMILLEQMKQELAKRQFSHDRSKLADPEVEMFTRMTGKLKGLTYGSDEYKQCLKDMGPALDHHYKSNRHHTAFFPNGIEDMNLIDVLEMLCDWKASSLRHDNGSIDKSIEINRERFGLSDQLVRIMQNTVPLFDGRFRYKDQTEV